jgi:hypothetical protein
MTMANRSLRRTPQERARWRENHERLARLLDLRLKRDGITKEQALDRLRNPDRPTTAS